MQDTKRICITQLLKKPQHGSYQEDDSVEFLTEFKNIKRLQELDEETKDEDFQFFFEADFQPLDFAEELACANYAGYVLYHTIMTESKCDTCAEAFVTDKDGQWQRANILIALKEYKLGTLIRPSMVANGIFYLSLIHI